eukprot:357329-Chlamydomonas_euryale.AAC.11
MATRSVCIADQRRCRARLRLPYLRCRGRGGSAGTRLSITSAALSTTTEAAVLCRMNRLGRCVAAESSSVEGKLTVDRRSPLPGRVRGESTDRHRDAARFARAVPRDASVYHGMASVSNAGGTACGRGAVQTAQPLPEDATQRAQVRAA